MFANAKVVSLEKTKPGNGKAYKPTDSIPGWEQLAALDAAAKALTALVELRKQAIVDDAIEPELIKRGIAAQRKPDSLSPVEGQAKGSAYLAKRSTRSPLTQDEITLINEVGNAADFTEQLEAQPSMLAVNPAYADDQALLKRIDKALANVKDLPEDFIIQTESQAKTVTSEAALDNLFKLDPEAISALMPILANTVLRPVFGGQMETAWELIKPLIPEAVEALAKPKSSTKPMSAKSAKAQLNVALKASLKA